MFDLTKDSDLKGIGFYIHDFLNKYGFTVHYKKSARCSQARDSSPYMELKESQKRTDEQLNRTDEQLCRTDKQLQKTIKKLDDIGDQLGDLGLVQGEVAEESFYRNIKGLFRPMDMRRRPDCLC